MKLPPGYLFTDHILSAQPNVRRRPLPPAVHLPRKTGATPPALLPEIYALIIPHLLCSLPPAGDKSTDDTLRQPYLATALRVSKAFYTIAAPILYHTIITTHLPSLLYNIDRPAASPGLKSKAELLGSTKNLHLEYAYYREPTYLSLMLHDGDYFGLLQPNNTDIVRFCAAECDKIAASAAKLASIPNRNLTRLSTGAFTSGQRFLWQMMVYAEDLPLPGVDISKRSEAASRALARLVVTSPHLEYFCQWARWGPLAFQAVVLYPEAGSLTRRLNYCCHLEPSTGGIPIVHGGTSRWYVPFSCPSEDAGLVQGTEILFGYLGNQLYFREQAWKKLDKARSARVSPSIDVDIYLSGSMAERGAKSYIEGKLAEASRKMYDNIGIPKARQEGNVWRIGRIQDAPPCRACGGVTMQGGIF